MKRGGSKFVSERKISVDVAMKWLYDDGPKERLNTKKSKLFFLVPQQSNIMREKNRKKKHR
jgi:hypothetical protein